MIRLDTSGAVHVLTHSEEGGPRGLASTTGMLYAMAEGGYTSRLLRIAPPLHVDHGMTAPISGSQTDRAARGAEREFTVERCR